MAITYKDTHDFSEKELKDLFFQWNGLRVIFRKNWL